MTAPTAGREETPITTAESGRTRQVTWFQVVRRLVRTRRAARLTSLALVILAWQFLVPLLPTELIPSPARVFAFMWDELRGDTLARTTVYQAFGISLGRLGLGFLLAFAIGVPIGLLMGASKVIENALHDFVVVALAMPSLIWALLTGMWFGLGNQAPVITVFLAAIPFVILNTMEGVKNVPVDLTEMARSYKVHRGRVVRHVAFPSLMPFFFASLRYGLANGWKGLVLAEVFSATNGAGWTIRYWYDAHRAQGVFGYAVFFMLFALLVERLIFERFSRRVFRWRPVVIMDIPETTAILAEEKGEGKGVSPADDRDELSETGRG